MPIYEFQCDKCGHSKEEFLTFSSFEKRNKTCVCGGILETVIGQDSLVVRLNPIVKDIKTVGQLAEYNVKTKGKYWAEDQELKNKTKKRPGKQLPEGMKYVETKKVEPIDTSILNASPQQIQKYIETGVKPLPQNKKTRKEKQEEAQARKRGEI